MSQIGSNLARIFVGTSDEEDNSFQEEVEIFELDPQAKQHLAPLELKTEEPAPLFASPEQSDQHRGTLCMSIEDHLFNLKEESDPDGWKHTKIGKKVILEKKKKKSLSKISKAKSVDRLKSESPSPERFIQKKSSKEFKSSSFNTGTINSWNLKENRSEHIKNRNSGKRGKGEKPKNLTTVGFRSSTALENDTISSRGSPLHLRSIESKRKNKRVTHSMPEKRDSNRRSRSFNRTYLSEDKRKSEHESVTAASSIVGRRSSKKTRKSKSENVTVRRRSFEDKRKHKREDVNIRHERNSNGHSGSIERRFSYEDKPKSKHESVTVARSIVGRRSIERKSKNKHDDAILPEQKDPNRRFGSIVRRGSPEHKRKIKREDVTAANAIVKMQSSSVRSSPGLNASKSVQRDSSLSRKAVRVNNNQSTNDERLSKLDTIHQVDRKLVQSRQQRFVKQHSQDKVYIAGSVPVKQHSRSIEYKVSPELSKQESVEQRRQKIPNNYDLVKQRHKNLDISENQSANESGIKNKSGKNVLTEGNRSTTYKHRKLHLAKKFSENFGYHLPKHGALPPQTKNLRKLIKYEEKLCVNINQEDYFKNLYKRTTASYRAKVDKENAQRYEHPANGHKGRENDRNANKQETTRRIVATSKPLPGALTEFNNQTRSVSAFNIAQRAPEKFLDDRNGGATIQRLPRKSNTHDAHWRKEHQTGSSPAWDTSTTQANTFDPRKHHTTADVGTTGVSRSQHLNRPKSPQAISKPKGIASDQGISYTQYLASQEQRQRRHRSPQGKHEGRYTDESPRRSRSVSRSKSSGLKPQTSDPVRLYQYYQSQWKRFRKNIPGQNSHSALRRAIHNKLLMDI